MRVGIRYFFPEGSSRTKLESANKVLRDDGYSKSYKNLSVGSRHEHRSAFSGPSLTVMNRLGRWSHTVDLQIDHLKSDRNTSKTISNIPSALK